MLLKENIKYLRKKQGISQDRMAEDLGYKSFTTIQKWETGIAEPPLSKVYTLAEYLGVSVNALTYDDLRSNVSKSTTHGKGIKIPVLGRVVAGVPLEATEEILDYEEISPELAATGEFFALQIQGSSMEPRILDGDVVIVKKQSSIENGETGVILINGSEATVKKVKREEKGITLIAFNTAVYEPQFYSNEEIEKLPLAIIGKVVELRGKF